ncbi:hypothetical protein RintRC_5869 [Richelia intracellularis]|nr:hypothetical protein RintRC_5869 [Richelia intracellularis]
MQSFRESLVFVTYETFGLQVEVNEAGVARQVLGGGGIIIRA